MVIKLNKFGTTLVSRQAGKEAYLAFTPSLKEIKDGEVLEIDFEGVVTFSPSWADEFISPLIEEFGNRVKMMSSNNPSVKITLALLKKIREEKKS